MPQSHHTSVDGWRRSALCSRGISQSDDGTEGAPPKDYPDKVKSLLNNKGLPPVHHPYWVKHIGFQQEDPVTNFFLGSVLILAMLLHVVEDCSCVHQRFLRGGSAAVLPYANRREGSVFRHVGELGEGLGNLAESLQIDGEASNGAGGEGLLARKVTDDDVVVSDNMLRIVGMVC